MRRHARWLAVAAAVAVTALGLEVGTAFAATPPPTPTPGPGGVWLNVPDPGAKATAPQTDLKNYPKGSGQAQARTPSSQAKPDANSAQVVSISAPDAKGVSMFRLYDPAPGVTPAQLAASLQKTGEDPNARAVLIPAKSSSGTVRANVADPNECVYGYAIADNFGFPGSYNCPIPYHWANEGFANPHVRFNDHTGSGWPINTVVYDWNTANGINSYYLYNSCPFQAGARCVDVSEENRPDHHYAGITQLPVNADHSMVDNQVKVTLNNAGAGPVSAHRSVACHELGHVLGLGHSDDHTGSCMTNDQNLPPRGDADDFAFLAGLYQIDR